MNKAKLFWDAMEFVAKENGLTVEGLSQKMENQDDYTKYSKMIFEEFAENIKAYFLLTGGEPVKTHIHGLYREFDR